MTKSLFIVVGLILFAAGCAGDGPRKQGQLTACKSNQKNLATALEMYASDFGGAYPSDLSKLKKHGKFTYLVSIPSCPTAESDTYSASYKCEVAQRDKTGKVVSGRDYFEFCCAGSQHKGVLETPVDRPGYNSQQGLLER